MNTTHTAGNWHAHDGQIYPEQTGKTLALIPYFDKENGEMQANLRLIAAAPDMLEALIDVEHMLESMGFNHNEKIVVERARAAIQKATQP